MADQVSKLPVESEDVKVEFIAAFARIDDVPVGKNLIDTMSDDDWLSVDPDSWKIEAGSSDCADEIDGLDDQFTSAA